MARHRNIRSNVRAISLFPQPEVGVYVELPAWYDDALCPQVDLDGFFPGPGHQRQAEVACRVCETCPVQAKCLEYALANEEAYGVWGGKTPHQRRQILKAMS